MLNIDIINNNQNKPFVVGFDYDGVITNRGSSGHNEEKWIEREKKLFWRKILNLSSTIYNRFFPLNEEVIELTHQLKAMNCKIYVISSHTLTTNNYKESIKTRQRVIKRLMKKNILFDDVFFVAGDKVEICKILGVNLMNEDNIDKVIALRNAGIPTIAKRTTKNAHLLDNDPSTIDNLLDVLPVVIKEQNNRKLINKTNTVIENNNDYNFSKRLFAFSPNIECSNLIEPVVNEKQKVNVLTKRIK